MNVDFVPFRRGVRVLCKPRLIFSRINGPNVLNNNINYMTRCHMWVHNVSSTLLGNMIFIFDSIYVCVDFVVFLPEVSLLNHLTLILCYACS